VRRTGRNTMGVQFAKPDRGDAIVRVARNPEPADEEEIDPEMDAESVASVADATDGAPLEAPDGTTSTQVSDATDATAAGDAGAVEADETAPAGDDEVPSSTQGSGDRDGSNEEGQQ